MAELTSLCTAWNRWQPKRNICQEYGTAGQWKKQSFLEKPFWWNKYSSVNTGVSCVSSKVFTLQLPLEWCPLRQGKRHHHETNCCVFQTYLPYFNQAAAIKECFGKVCSTACISLLAWKDHNTKSVRSWNWRLLMILSDANHVGRKVASVFQTTW